MATEPVINVVGSESGNAIKGELTIDEKVSNQPENASPIKKLEDVNQKRILDDDFRLTVEKQFAGIATLPANWNDLTVREQRDWVRLKVKDHWPDMPEILQFIYVASMIDGDSGQSPAVAPEWLDREKFQRGQRFAMKNLASVMMTELISLIMLFTSESGLKALIFTGKSSNPFTSFKRYLSTAKRMNNWYSSDVWTAGTVGQRDMQTVRKMHANVRKKLANSSDLEIKEATTIQNPWSPCIAKIREDFQGSCRPSAVCQYPFVLSEKDKDKRPKGVNQFEMIGTQFAFVSLVILYPEKFGIHGASDEDLDAFCHVWRGFGYLLGIDEEFNICKGSFEEVKQRSRDLIEHGVKPNLRNITPEWEHMFRCAVEGTNYYFPVLTYEHYLLYLTEVLDIPMPRMRASLSYASWIYFNVMRFNFCKGTLEEIKQRSRDFINYWIKPNLRDISPELEHMMRHVTKGTNDYILTSSYDHWLLYIADVIGIPMPRLRASLRYANWIHLNLMKFFKNLEIATPKVLQKAPFLVFILTFLLLSLSIIVGVYLKG